MQYRIDRKSGDKLSILGFGCMRFPDRRKAEEMVMRAIDGGLNYFDTAWAYPGSEETLGTILEKNHAREKALVATKLPLILLKSPADFDKYFDQSCKRLKTGYIDYYLLHMITDMDQNEELTRRYGGMKTSHGGHGGYGGHGENEEE